MAKAKKDKQIFRFKNIGPIGNAELELGDLTVIAGANNSGKTYLTYTLYGFLKYVNDLTNIDIDKISVEQLARLEHMLLMGNKLFPRIIKSNLDIKTHLEENGILKMSMEINDVKKYISNIVKYICKDFSNEIVDVFASSREEFKKSVLQCEMKNICSSKSKNYTLEVDRSTEKVEITISNALISPSVDTNSIVFKNFIKGIVLGVFIRQQLPFPFILSAERLGIYLFYKELDFTKGKIIEDLQKLGEKTSNKDMNSYINKHAARYAKPIKDNIDHTRDLELIQKRTGYFADRKFFDDIKNMMGGYYRYENNSVFFIFQKEGEGEFKIPLHAASSSVRELSDFYFYLKHSAQKGELLIIDEPESHLDTANQILMARMLARCVNAGMKILITTHSDYIIKEFNNLIMLSHEFPEKKSFLHHHKKEYTAEGFLKRESVKAYICGDGTLARCEVDSRGMIMPIFDKTIDDINNISDMLDSYLPREE